jgi:hypothetical protein
MKPRPRFWWDFTDTHTLIVASDSVKYPILAQFVFDTDATLAICAAGKLIADLDAGRLTPKQVVADNVDS